MAMEWMAQYALPLLLAGLAFPLITLLAPLYAARMLVDRLERGTRAERRRARLNDTLKIHALYEGTANMADRLDALERGMQTAAQKGDAL